MIVEQSTDPSSVRDLALNGQSESSPVVTPPSSSASLPVVNEVNMATDAAVPSTQLATADDKTTSLSSQQAEGKDLSLDSNGESVEGNAIGPTHIPPAASTQDNASLKDQAAPEHT